jgi:hypothetical protein
MLISALDGGDYSVSRAGCFTHEALALPTGQEAGLAPELVWTLVNWRKTFWPCQESNSIHPVSQKCRLQCTLL